LTERGGSSSQAGWSSIRLQHSFREFRRTGAFMEDSFVLQRFAPVRFFRALSHLGKRVSSCSLLMNFGSVLSGRSQLYGRSAARAQRFSLSGG